jgi:hypothetical protein
MTGTDAISAQYQAIANPLENTTGSVQRTEIASSFIA